MRMLECFLYIGNLFAVTPTTITGKKYSSALLFFLTIFVTATTIFKKEDYMTMIPVKLIIAILMDLSLLLFNCTIILVPNFWMRKEWFVLVKKLEASRNKEKNLGFLLTQVFFWMVTMYDTYAWSDVMGFEFVKQYGIEIFQSFLLFYFQSFLHLVFRRVKTLKLNVRGLYATTELFSKVFGWSFMLMVVYTILQILNYFDDSFDNYSLYNDDKEYNEVVISNICFLVITTGYTVYLICLWDSVVEAAEKTAKESGEKNFVPRFRAANFFDVDKTLIVSMINVLFTFVIVMVQFKEH